MQTIENISADVVVRAKRIRMFLMDIDGTLTDGGICLISPPTLPQGESCQEMKVFHAQDGPGLQMAHDMGIVTGFITGRKSPAVSQRARELNVTYVYLGQSTKTAAFEECLAKSGVSAEETAYLGDDLPDIAIAKRVGLACCVADGSQDLKDICHYVLTRNGGRGTAREVVELILKSQGRWAEAVGKAHAGSVVMT